MKYLVTGSGGQLAREFVKMFESRSADHLAPSESACDITDPAAVERIIGTYRPTVILNCAAYNHVDQAETDRGIAMRVNADGPRNIAESASRYGARLVHFSSDYVFDGTKQNGLYVEADATSPLNEYGRTKLAGEQAVREVLDERVLILRLSWVFGPGRQNFVHKFMQRVDRMEPLLVTCDEFSVPSWTGTIVDITSRALAHGVTGTYHATNSGFCSRYEWARFILRARGIDRFVRPVTRDMFALPAKRPMFSAMDNGAITRALGITIPSWEETVAAFVKDGMTP
jgi:dTDP-4-dehydrorhamnose reductase